MLRVALLGSGFMGAVHAAAYRTLAERAQVTTVCGLEPDRAASIAEGLGAHATTDLEEAMADPEIDVVDVCLPTALHREAAERALAAGKHVLLEKPIALTSEDAAAILYAAGRSGCVFMVGLVLRFWPEYVELQRRTAAGELGRPLAVSAQRLSGVPDWNEWMADPAQSGGTAVDLMIHDFDQINWLLGRPRRVFAVEPGPGHVQALVEYEGATASVEGSLRMPASRPFSSSIRVVCEGGVAEYSFASEPVEGEGNIGAASSAGGLRLYPAGGDAATVSIESVEPWTAELAYFLDCVDQGLPPERGTGEQARLALDVALAANRSIASGRAEPV